MQSKESQIYQNSKIGLSISHYCSDRYTSDRLLRIMASGCFALVHHYPNIEKDFTPGEHIDTFKNDSELIEKIDYYLGNEEERNRIAKQGYELVHSKHTYKNMVEDIINLK
jgi:spore maturation protein CgeB